MMSASKTFLVYVPKTSPIHRLHPLTKLSIMIMLGLMAMFVNDLYGMIILFIISFTIIVVSRIPLRVLSGYIMAIIGVVQLIIISYMFLKYIPGSVVYFERYIYIAFLNRTWHIYITDASVIFTLTMSIRFLVMFLTTIFFFATTKDRDIIYGLRKIKVPYLVCLLFALTFRGLTMFIEDYYIVKEAMMAKGLDFKKGSLIKKLKRYAYLIVPLFVLMVKRSEEVANALEARGIPIRGGKRTTYHDLPLKTIDYIVLTATFSFFFGTLIGQYFLDIRLGNLLQSLVQKLTGGYAY